MAHYRKIDIRIWLDHKFNTLSSDSQLVFLYLLTHPQLTALGAMRSTVPGLAAELGWPLARFEVAFEALCQQALVAWDQKACFVWAMNFLKYNAPESPNVVKSWGACLDYLPECDLKQQLIQKTRTFLENLPPAFQEALPACFESTSPLEACTTETQIETALPDHAAPLPPLPVTLTEALSEKAILPQKSLPEGFAEGFEEGFEKACPNHRTLNIEHKALSIKQEQEQKQKEKRSLPEKNSEEHIQIEAINHIVAPTRQKIVKPPDAEIVEVFHYWKHTLDHPQAILDAKRCKRIRQALTSGYSVSQLCDAILGCSYTPHNMGDNEQGQRYDSLHVILRDADQIDRFIRNAHSPPRPQNAADRLLNTNMAAGQRWLEKKRRAAEKVIDEAS